jgi:hypothetical protein
MATAGAVRTVQHVHEPCGALGVHLYLDGGAAPPLQECRDAGVGDGQHPASVVGDIIGVQESRRYADGVG